jgi:DNA-directed RNA polymerase subunit RPC12/RpoP
MKIASLSFRWCGALSIDAHMRANTRRKAIMENPQRTLRVVEARGIENVVDAPPILIASSHTIDYVCGNCRTVLLHAEDNQVHGLSIHCTQCGACNATDD